MADIDFETIIEATEMTVEDEPIIEITDNLESEAVIEITEISENSSPPPPTITSVEKLNGTVTQDASQSFTVSKLQPLLTLNNSTGSLILYSCSNCDSSFTTQHGLNVHKRVKHKPRIVKKSPVFRCQYCNKGFGLMKAMDSHEGKHIFVTENSETFFQCHQCYKLFADPVQVKKHAIIHRYRGMTTKNHVEIIPPEKFSEERGIFNCCFCSSVCKTEKTRYLHELQHVKNQYWMNLTSYLMENITPTFYK